MKYSFIVPVYNVEECLNSLLCQNYTDFEIIVIDDGATDSSYERCNEIAKKDQRVRIIRQKNMGLGEARNTGIRAAQGQYLIFVDSDDFWLDETCLSKIDKQLLKFDCDVLSFNYREFDTISKEYKRNYFHLKNKLNVADDKKRIKKMIISSFWGISAWRKVLSREFIINNNIFFNKGLSEDMDWGARLLIYTTRIYFLNEDIYCYRKNRFGSITDKVKRNFLSGWCDILDRILKYYKESELNNKNIYYYMAKLYRLILINYLKSDKKNRYIRKKILEYKYLIPYLTGIKMLPIKVANFFSLDLFLKILNK